MIRKQQQKIKGFTLLEILLVLAIASSLVVLMLNYTTQRSDELRRDKTVLQMQQILNAGMSFYLNNSFWPLVGASISIPSYGCGSTSWTTTQVLKTSSYIPTNLTNNSYAEPYKINCNIASKGGGFFVSTKVDSPTNAAIIAGRLPLAYVTTESSLGGAMPPVQAGSCLTPPYSDDCRIVVANVNIPGQNLNNARSVNFASIYYSGSCVPAPNCPPGMRPNIMVMPGSVSGVFDPLTSCGADLNSCVAKITPISSFIAFARGDSTGAPVNPTSGGGGPPPSCTSGAVQACTAGSGSISSDGTKYWRVCLSVSTQKGTISPSGGLQTQQGKLMGSIVAITRCVPNDGNESPAGSINVWQP